MKKITLLLLACHCQLFAFEEEKAQPFEPAEPVTPVQSVAPAAPAAATTPATPAPPSPWFTGPLIVPTGTVTAYGDWYIESYLYVTANTGVYNNHWNSSSTENFYSIEPQWIAFFGITPWADINIIPQFFYNFTSGQRDFGFGDFTVGLDVQLLDAGYTPYFPGIKFAIREVFPTGKFQHLSPRKLHTDSFGAGTFGTQFDLEFYKQFQLSGIYWMTLTASFQYQVNTPVHVHGLNTYGGGHRTNGHVMGGNQFQGIISFEFSLSRNWVFAIDNVYIHTDKTTFCGKPGFNSDGTAASVGGPSSEQISFAPAIEYNFNSHFGIIAGCWLSAAGRNSTQFRSGVINFNYVY